MRSIAVLDTLKLLGLLGFFRLYISYGQLLLAIISKSDINYWIMKNIFGNKL